MQTLTEAVPCRLRPANGEKLKRAALVVSFATACAEGRSISLEVRGIPPATTAYATVSMLSAAAADSIVAESCGAYADSMEYLPKRIAVVWDSLDRAALQAGTSDVKRKCNGSAGDCGYAAGSAIGDLVIVSMARNPDPEVHRYLPAAAALRRRVVAWQEATKDSASSRLRSALRHTIVTELLKLDSLHSRLDASGLATIKAADTSRRPVVVIAAPDTPLVAFVTTIPADGKVILPYDRTTFDPLRYCSLNRK
jgi:hypothetical protein